MFSFKQGGGSEWTAVTFQTIVLGADLYLIANQGINIFLGLSLACVASIFLLQITYKRFLMLFPVQPFLNVPTPHWDTYILRFMLSLTFIFFVLGAWNLSMSILIMVVLAVIIAVLIVLLGLWLEKNMPEKITKELRDKGKITFIGECPNCRRRATVKRCIIDEETGREDIECKNCGGPESQDTKVIIGYYKS